MDVTPYLEPRIAPRAVFDSLEERRSRVRFMLPDGGGDFRAITWGAYADQIRKAALFVASEMKSGERAAIFAPNRVEWMSAALGIQAAGGVMVPIYASSTAEQAAYVVEHSDARVLFVDTPALLRRVLSIWPQLEGVNRIVALDDGLDVAGAAESLRSEGIALPSYSEIERKVIGWSRAIAIGKARDQEDPAAFERTMDSVSLEQPGLMLYTSGTSACPRACRSPTENVAVNGADWLRVNAPLLDEGAIDLLWLPMSHIFGFGEATSATPSAGRATSPTRPT